MSLLPAVIGLEVHARLKTRTKMFCGCPAEFGGEPNTRVCPVCLGSPGALPNPNREAVRQAVRFALAIGCEIHRASGWARKNYFYPDLPKGYQITQFDRPLATGGRIRVEPPDAAPRFVAVTRMHLEEDAGKSVHEGFAPQRSGVDLNRCGAPLIEIVGAPEIRDPDEAQAYLERLRSILKAVRVCDADMEKGSLRCDANVSVHREGEPLGTRVEIKNLNSFRAVRRALAYEIERQSAARAAGEPVVHETRLWHDPSGRTRPMRSKEEAHDYRYFPEPDLPPLVLDDALLASAAADLPEPPDARRDRFVRDYGLPPADAQRLTLEPALADYFEDAAAASGAPRPAANWVLSVLLGRLNDEGLAIEDCPLPAARLGELVALVERGAITGPAAREVFDESFRTGGAPGEILGRRGLESINDPALVEAACREVLAAHPEQVESYRRGKTRVLDFFVGQVMRKTRGAADPERVDQALRRLLEDGC